MFGDLLMKIGNFHDSRKEIQRAIAMTKNRWNRIAHGKVEAG